MVQKMSTGLIRLIATGICCKQRVGSNFRCCIVHVYTEAEQGPLELAINALVLGLSS